MDVMFRKSDSFLSEIGIEDFDVVLCTGRIRWVRHVECGAQYSWIAEVHKTNCCCTEDTAGLSKHGMKWWWTTARNLEGILLTFRTDLCG